VKRNMHDGRPGRTMRMGAYSLRDARYEDVSKKT